MSPAQNEIERLDRVLVWLARIRWAEMQLAALDFRPKEDEALIGRKEAARIAQKDERTIRRWVEVHGIGFRTPGGRWQIRRSEFLLFLMSKLAGKS